MLHVHVRVWVSDTPLRRYRSNTSCSSSTCSPNQPEQSGLGSDRAWRCSVSSKGQSSSDFRLFPGRKSQVRWLSEQRFTQTKAPARESQPAKRALLRLREPPHGYGIQPREQRSARKAATYRGGGGRKPAEVGAGITGK